MSQYRFKRMTGDERAVAAMSLSWFFLFPASLFLLLALASLRQLAWARRLPALSELRDSPSAAGVTCSIVVAARDDAEGLAATVSGLLAQQEARVEVIVVDDRSTDETPAVLATLAARDSRVRVLRVEALPEGWLGKCHACHRGAGIATGEWLLFTDADCRLPPDVLARALRVARREGAAHVTMTPGVEPETLAATAYHLALLTRLSGWVAAVNRDRPGAYFGAGAFNLVRSDVYRASGGHAALRLTVVDDVRLGLLVQRAGGRTRAFIGGPDAECRWGTTVRSMVRIMEKNYFAAADYRVGHVIAGAIVGVILWGSALAGVLSATAPGWAAFLAPWTLAIPAVVLAHRLGWPVGPALLAPCFYPVLQYAVIRSAWVTLRRRGVRWRETFYPLEELRRGTLR
jgi:cellulose synthase/poly-beta-1,6-N-acetylglucosamine synthase-like glycosyltransferase